MLQTVASAQTLTNSAKDEIDAFLGSYVKSGKLTGLVALVATRDATIYHQAFGNQNVAEDIAMKPDSLFRIASMTKPVTSVAVMQLVEKGRVALDDPIGMYLPKFANLEKLSLAGTQSVESDVTIRQLLNHTSGFGYFFSDHKLSDINRDTKQNYEDLPLVHEPGTKWTYGCGTRILGFLVEEVSGKSLDQYFEKNILSPLGMSDTYFLLSESDMARLVTVHWRETNGLREDELKDNEDGEIVGDYGLRSTAADYSKFLQMLLNGGTLNGQRILSKESVKQMTSNQIGRLVVQQQPAARRKLTRAFPIGAGQDKFGLGFQLSAGSSPKERSPGSYSWAGIYNTHFWVDPERRVAVVILMQVLPFYDEECIGLLQGLERRLYEHLEGPRE